MIISWNTTNKCNMKCRHCYRDAGSSFDDELTTAEALTLIDQIARAGFKIMIFSGGEPLLRPDILQLLRRAADRGLRPVIGTNGVLLDAKMVEALQQAGAKAIGISLDSLDEQKHNAFRGFPDAWRLTVAGMENCRRAGLPFQIHTTVMDWNKDELEAITDFAVSMGAMAHHIFFLVPTGRAVSLEAESLRAAEYEDTIRRIMVKQQQTPIELKPTCAPQFMRIADQLGMKLRFSRGCLAGTSYCIINPHGQVQPCAYLTTVAGDVRQTPFDEIWRSGLVLQKLRTLEYAGGCGSCCYKQRCGGCRARAAFYHEGDYMAEEPWCLYRQENETGGLK